ncbi:MAG TPA: type II 3-dehydroquinate dehydratase [Acidimicrobiales bacterium]|nr:type II 3-dehydroquinate dehydratase [Acidimicrobiales bacterium]
MSGYVLVLSGPNLGSLGARDPAVYGTATLDELLARTAAAAATHDLGVRHVHSNHEGDLVDAIEQREPGCAGVIANLGALTHTSVVLHDALEVVDCPVIEVHLSNPAAREPFRHVSVVAPVVAGSIAGFGPLSYDLAVEAIARLAAR